METTRDRILAAAVRLFARDGYEAVSVEQIAGAVGIRAPSLYKHFRSKRDIFDHILAEMERRDAENAAECSLPTEPADAAPEAYDHVSGANLLGFCRKQFLYWTEDPFASDFRKMLTVEQYRSEDMNALYHQYLGAGPLRYVEDILGSREEALSLYGPMFLLYSAYDAADDKEEVLSQLDAHLLDWRARRSAPGTTDGERRLVESVTACSAKALKDAPAGESIATRSERISPEEYVEFLSRTDLGSQYPKERFAERISRLLENASVSLTARDEAGRIVGALLGLTDFAYWLYVTDLGVDRRLAGRGIGTRLMRAAHALAGGEKDIAVYLVANEDAVPFYEKLGMERADDVMRYNHIDWTEFTVGSPTEGKEGE